MASGNPSITDPHQAGFRKGRQCLDNLVRLETDIRCGYYLKMYTMSVFLDMHSAYSMVPILGLLIKMKDMGFCGRLLHFVHNFLTNRTFCVDMVELSDVFSVHTREWSGPGRSSVSHIVFDLDK